jgi:glycosyltransferase involved in cell wall biosynthesis
MALEQQALDLQAELIAIDDAGPLDWRVIGRLARLCRRERVAIWHGHDYKSNALGLLVRRYWPMHLVSTVHGWVHNTARTPLYYFIDRCCLRWYGRVLCVSRDLETRVRRAGVARQRCQVLENGIEADRFRRRQTTSEARVSLGLPRDLPLIGAVGRLAKEKDFATFLRAFAAAIQLGLQAQAVLVGDGAQRLALEQLAKELQVVHLVHFAGHCADVRPWYEAMDLFVLSSLREAMPNVVLEAMAMEVPVIATRIAGVPDMLEHQRSGYLVEPGEAIAMTQAMHQLVSSHAQRLSLASAARATIEARYSFHRRMDRMQQIYDDVLLAAPPAASVPSTPLIRAEVRP